MAMYDVVYSVRGADQPIGYIGHCLRDGFVSPRGAERDMMSGYSDSQTSLTLMDMLRQHPKNADAWDRFVRLYRPKIYGWCRTWGLQEADAEDVAQDVITKLTEKMSNFQYDRSRCFRAWLKTITQHALSDLVASRHRAVGSQSTPMWETIEARADLERQIEEICNRELLELAISKVQERVATATWHAFRLTAFEGHSGAEASRLLHIPVASVFVAKHRVQKMLKEEIDKLEGVAE
jgi:RNA polymerase sigma factor (sigma-70 family)